MYKQLKFYNVITLFFSYFCILEGHTCTLVHRSLVKGTVCIMLIWMHSKSHWSVWLLRSLHETPCHAAVIHTLSLPSGSFNVAKVIVVGDVAVGKTCLISRWGTNKSTSSSWVYFWIFGVKLLIHFRSKRKQGKPFLWTITANNWKMCNLLQEVYNTRVQIIKRLKRSNLILLMWSNIFIQSLHLDFGIWPCDVNFWI